MVMLSRRSPEINLNLMNINDYLDNDIAEEKLLELMTLEVHRYINSISQNHNNFLLHKRKIDLLINHIEIINSTIKKELKLHTMDPSTNSKDIESQVKGDTVSKDNISSNNTNKNSIFSTLVNSIAYFQISLDFVKKIAIYLVTIIILLTLLISSFPKFQYLKSKMVGTIIHSDSTAKIDLENNELSVLQFLTPEEEIIINVQSRINDLITSHHETLIDSFEIDFSKNCLVLLINKEWYDLPVKEQDNWTQEIFEYIQELNLSKLIIKNLNNVVIARSPVVGKQVVIFRRHI